MTSQGRVRSSREPSSGEGNAPGWQDPRDRLITAYSADRTFVDVGGLYGEKVSVASGAKAKALTMLDIADAARPQWAKFRAAMSDAGIEVECLNADLFTVDRQWEIVHSSGVLYHIPNPFHYLEKLRRIATNVVILTSTTTPRSLSTEAGTLQVPAGAALLIPALAPDEQKIVESFFAPYDVGSIMRGAGGPWSSSNYRRNWWLPTADALQRMTECAGFEVLQREDFPLEVYPATTLLLRAT